MFEGIWQDVVVQIHNIRILCVLVIRAFFPIKQKNCHIGDKATALQPHKWKFQRDWLFWSSFTPRTAMKTCQFSCDKFLASRHTWNLVHGKCLVSKLQTFRKYNNKFCMHNELKCYIKTVLMSKYLSKSIIKRLSKCQSWRKWCAFYWRA